MRIPEYRGQANPPPGLQAPTISPGAAGAPYRGLAGLGKAVEDLGQKIQEQKDNISRTNELTNRITGAEADIVDLEGRLDQEQDPDTAMEKFDAGYNEIRDKWMDGVEDSKVLNALTQHFGEREVQANTSMKHKVLQWTIQHGQAQVIEDLDAYSKLAANAEDDIGFYRNLDLAYQLLDNAGATGLYSPDKVVTLKQKTRQNFFVQRYNKMIQDDPEAAIRNFGWLRQIGDTQKELELLSKAVTWANRVDTQQDKDFREQSGALLNQMLVDITMGRMNRAGVNLVVGSGKLTDEHERILLNEIDTYEKSPAHSDPERLGFWKQTIEEAALRKDEGGLRSFMQRIHDDPQITKSDRAALYATLQVKLGKAENETKEFKDGYREAVNVLDRFFQFNPMTMTFKSPTKAAAHRAALRKVQDASAGRSRDPKTGKVTAFPPLSGWGLVDYANRLVEEYEAEQAIKRQQFQNEIPEIPTQGFKGSK